MYTHLVPDRRIRATIKSRLDERIRTNTLKAFKDKIKVNETIVDRVGSYYFLPTLIASRSRRKQCPLHSVNSESSFLGCAGSEGYSKDWSPSSMRAPQHKPNDSTRIGTGQSSFRGRVRCQSPFIAGERRRCEPGSNSVIVTASLTRCEGHVLRLGGVRRTRKIFVGCPAIRPFWDQSPGIRNPRLETVGNRLYPLHDQDCLRRFTAEAQIQDRSRTKTGPNTAPAFSRVFPSFPRRREPRENKARHLPLSRRREPREKQSTPFTPFHRPLSRSAGRVRNRFRSEVSTAFGRVGARICSIQGRRGRFQACLPAVGRPKRRARPMRAYARAGRSDSPTERTMLYAMLLSSSSVSPLASPV